METRKRNSWNSKKEHNAYAHARTCARTHTSFFCVFGVPSVPFAYSHRATREKTHLSNGTPMEHFGTVGTVVGSAVSQKGSGMATMTFWHWVDSIGDNHAIYNVPGIDQYDVMSGIDYIYESQFFNDGCKEWSVQQWKMFLSEWCHDSCIDPENSHAQQRTFVFDQMKEMYLKAIERKRGKSSAAAPAETRPARTKYHRTVPLGLRWQVLERDGHRCKVCGATPATDESVKLHVDHIVPVSRGGSSRIENLQTLCSHCNLGKSDRMPIGAAEPAITSVSRKSPS